MTCRLNKSTSNKQFFSFYLTSLLPLNTFTLDFLSIMFHDSTFYYVSSLLWDTLLCWLSSLWVLNGRLFRTIPESLPVYELCHALAHSSTMSTIICIFRSPKSWLLGPEWQACTLILVTSPACQSWQIQNLIHKSAFPPVFFSDQLSQKFKSFTTLSTSSH